MEQNRVRIVDIAEELGLSTATVSTVIHGKTKKLSRETVNRVKASAISLSTITTAAYRWEIICTKKDIERSYASPITISVRIRSVWTGAGRE